MRNARRRSPGSSVLRANDPPHPEHGPFELQPLGHVPADLDQADTVIGGNVDQLVAAFDVRRKLFATWLWVFRPLLAALDQDRLDLVGRVGSGGGCFGTFAKVQVLLAQPFLQLLTAMSIEPVQQLLDGQLQLVSFLPERFDRRVQLFTRLVRFIAMREQLAKLPLQFDQQRPAGFQLLRNLICIMHARIIAPLDRRQGANRISHNCFFDSGRNVCDQAAPAARE